MKLELGTPAAVPGSDWGCRVRIKGLPESFDQKIFGIDAIQALELALRFAGQMLARFANSKAGTLGLWDKPIRSLTDLALPLPVSHVQGQLPILAELLRRLRFKKAVDRRWQNSMLQVMREVAAELENFGPPG